MIQIRRPRVLIVEDDPDLLVVLRLNLRAAGFETLLASDGQTALARIDAERPEVVLLDVMLPGVDGWSVLEELHRRGDPVGVIVCSGKRHAEDAARAERLGASAYIVKPFDIERVLDAANDVVARRRLAGSATLPARQVPEVGLA